MKIRKCWNIKKIIKLKEKKLGKFTNVKMWNCEIADMKMFKEKCNKYEKMINTKMWKWLYLKCEIVKELFQNFKMWKLKMLVFVHSWSLSYIFQVNNDTNNFITRQYFFCLHILLYIISIQVSNNVNFKLISFYFIYFFKQSRILIYVASCFRQTLIFSVVH